MALSYPPGMKYQGPIGLTLSTVLSPATTTDVLFDVDIDALIQMFRHPVDDQLWNPQAEAMLDGDCSFSFP